ncbi:heavy metal-binding domain-containing protein [Lactobacillus sp. ESL0791]|uniref:heavy metal-binding domain-containing protein n=1 Tax=Lactobacillus sp. ESL0791 TaxID=2983234 RepID=UPI0023F749D2|nr:heavy metal-binding domain-containing protein [Lactobacillus sp. ESL0791]MDF7638068.1 heavy metal-binding domain-containing protein [Lactobacillus sp. ESL0791]
MAGEQILVTTTEQIPGKSYEIIGEVFGLTTQSKNMFKDMGAGLKSMVGGEIRSYTKMLEDSRVQALERLRQSAQDMDADAVVMMRFDSGSIGGDMQSVVAYGTAVRYVTAE